MEYNIINNYKTKVDYQLEGNMKYNKINNYKTIRGEHDITASITRETWNTI